MGETMEFPNEEAVARDIAALSVEEANDALVAEVRQRMEELEGLTMVDAIMNIAHHCASLPVDDDRTADEILGYDEHGLPT